MSPYATLLANARQLALQALLDALKAATDPAETRRIACAIFKAPAPDEQIDRAVADPQPTLDRRGSSATSREHSERTGLSAPSDPLRPTHPNTSSTRPPNPSPRSGPVVKTALQPARPTHPLIQRKPTPASLLLAHSGRAP